jgi:hypothetical protein
MYQKVLILSTIIQFLTNKGNYFYLFNPDGFYESMSLNAIPRAMPFAAAMNLPEHASNWPSDLHKPANPIVSLRQNKPGA